MKETTPKEPHSQIERKMSLEEMRIFLTNIVWSEMSEAYQADMLLWMFKSIGEYIMEEKIDAADAMSELARFIYTDISQHGLQSYYKYQKEIVKRIKTFDYSFKNNENTDKIEREVYGEKVLERHSANEYIKLAENISQVLKNEHTPDLMNYAIINELHRIDPQITHFTPEIIADTLKKEETDKILDLSNHSTKEDECLDLAKHLSAVMLDKNTPTSVYNALAHELTDQKVPPETYYSPENIAKIICKDGENE